MAAAFSRDPYPSDQEIAELAYKMFLQVLNPGTSAAGTAESSRRIADYWRAAEAELLERAAARVINRGDSRGPRSRK